MALNLILFSAKIVLLLPTVILPATSTLPVLVIAPLEIVPMFVKLRLASRITVEPMLN